MPKQYQDKALLFAIIQLIKELRKEDNITLEVFYFDTGIHLARIEQGKTNISISTLAKICAYFSISLSEFFARLEN
ncbi:helix-turn-helix domain-containing protein [Flavobacterium sp.]|jgi:transcriptional regulator with XRE-family HTH domain|uniref:helix-turn-helix domain-containing protein n=1 Tax=Flavobacterium sp. TaxID=239 RepID=UPI0037C01E41